MEHSLLDQAATQIRQSKSLAIIIPEQPSSDALGASLALLAALEKGQHAVRVVSPRFTLPPNHSFLPKSQSVKQDLATLRDFIITLNTGKTKADALRYDMDDKALRIYVTPKSGFFEASDVTTTAGTFAYDTIVTLDLPNLENLGELHRSNAEFFYHTPVINIDHNSANTRYGHINLVDLTASSVSEIIFGLIKTLNEQWLDEHIATNLLTGIISKTKTFQNQGVTPRSLAIASHLMAAGARRDEIIRNLYQTKNIPTLQLWGRALAKIQSTADGKIVWSVLNKEDLVTTGGNPMMAAGVLDELMINTPQAEFVGLVVEVDGGAQVFIVAEQPFATPLPAPFELSSPTFAAATVKGAVSDGQQQLLTVLGAK